MKNLLLLFLMVAASVACTAKPKGYTIDGRIEGAGNGIAILRIYTRQPVPADTVVMANDRFSFSGETPQVRNAEIYVTAADGRTARINLKIENVPITIRAEWNDDKLEAGYGNIFDFADGLEIEGGPNHEFEEELNRRRAAVIERPEYAEYRVLSDKARDYARKGMTAEANEIFDQLGPISAAYHIDRRNEMIEMIKANPDLEAAASRIEMLVHYIPNEELESIYNSLTERVRESEMAQGIRKTVEQIRQLMPGMPAPHVPLEQPDGTKLSLTDLRGNVVLIDFWASWCQPCRMAFPYLKELYAKYHSYGFEILGVSRDDNKDAWLKAVENDSLQWPQVIDNPSDNLSADYAVGFIPFMILVDKEGMISTYHIRKQELEDKLEELLGL